MNIMHNKMEKFITQLRHATHGNSSLYVKVELNVTLGYFWHPAAP